MRRLIAVAAVVVILAAGYGVYLAYAPVEVAPAVRVLIERGDGSSMIANKLDDAGVLKSRTAFRVLARLRGVDRRLRPGLYEFEGPTRLNDVIDILRDGRAVTVTVRVLEGWTIDQMAYYFDQELIFDSTKFIDVTQDRDILREQNVPIDNLEGYLLPDTYEFFWGVKAREVVETMANANKRLFETDSILARMAELGWSRHEVLTLASMIEAETGLIDERAIISGVFHNRLDRGMLLQCDPTVVYGMGGLAPGQRLLRKHLTIESDYNTYLNPGLPPGPICNPGRSSIYAALYPAETDAIYFVANGEGGHVFSETLNEHNRASAELRKLRRERQ